MIRISNAANTMAPCWIVLEELGYTVTVQRTADAELWIARREKEQLQAKGPCALLGLAKLVEAKGRNWRASDEQISEFLQQFYGID
jgi:hypothetical protein